MSNGYGNDICNDNIIDNFSGRQVMIWNDLIFYRDKCVVY